MATPAEVQQFCTINGLRFQNLTHLPAETAPNQSDLTHRFPRFVQYRRTA